MRRGPGAVARHVCSGAVPECRCVLRVKSLLMHCALFFHLQGLDNLSPICFCGLTRWPWCGASMPVRPSSDSLMLAWDPKLFTHLAPSCLIPTTLGATCMQASGGRGHRARKSRQNGSGRQTHSKKQPLLLVSAGHRIHSMPSRAGERQGRDAERAKYIKGGGVAHRWHLVASLVRLRLRRSPVGRRRAAAGVGTCKVYEGGGLV